LAVDSFQVFCSVWEPMEPYYPELAHMQKLLTKKAATRLQFFCSLLSPFKVLTIE
jgi:hypothetical protein